MKRRTLLALSLSVIIILPAFILTIQEPLPENALDLQLHLIFEYFGTTGGSFQLGYMWSANDARTTGPSIKLSWFDQSALAVGVSSNPIHQKITEAFAEIRILDDTLNLRPDGTWSLRITQQVNNHVTLGISAHGLNDTISNIYVSSDLSPFPWSMKSALKDLGVDYIDVKARVVLQISGAFLGRLFTNIGRVLQFYVNLVMETIDRFLGTVLCSENFVVLIFSF